MKKSTRILLIIALTLLLIFISVPGLMKNSLYRYDDASRYTAGESEITGKISAIDIDWVSGDIAVARYDGDRIILKETSSRRLKASEQVHWLVDDGTLYVRFVRSGTRYSRLLGKELTLLLPEDLQLEDIHIITVTSDVEGDLPAAAEVILQGVSSNMDVTFAETKAVEVDTVSGDLTLRFPVAPESISADAVSADITIQLPQEAGFTAELDSISGDLAGRLLDSAASGKHYVRGDGACRIDADAVSGNLTIDPYTR